MGTGDMAVVTPELRAHGVDGLYVVDASVMLDLPNGNINAAVMMIAERAADLIRVAAGQNSANQTPHPSLSDH